MASNSSQTIALAATRTSSQDQILAVRRHRKAILICLLIEVLAIPTLIALPAEIRPALIRVWLGPGVILVRVASAVFVFLLANELSSKASGLLLSLLMFIPIPFMGIAVVLYLNAKAANLLRQSDQESGFLSRHTGIATATFFLAIGLLTLFAYLATCGYVIWMFITDFNPTLQPDFELSMDEEYRATFYLLLLLAASAVLWAISLATSLVARRLVWGDPRNMARGIDRVARLVKMMNLFWCVLIGLAILAGILAVCYHIK
jgi:hypothetical protein